MIALRKELPVKKNASIANFCIQNGKSVAKQYE